MELPAGKEASVKMQQLWLRKRVQESRLTVRGWYKLMNNERTGEGFHVNEQHDEVPFTEFRRGLRHIGVKPPHADVLQPLFRHLSSHVKDHIVTRADVVKGLGPLKQSMTPAGQVLASAERQEKMDELLEAWVEWQHEAEQVRADVDD